MRRPGLRQRLRTALLLGATIVSGLAGRGSGQGTTCVLDSSQTEWIPTSLAAWEEVARHVLRMPSDELPWIILFDTQCVWHLAPGASADGTPIQSALAFSGGAVPVEVRSHGGQLSLPDGREIPTAPLAFTALQPGDTLTYSVAALPEVWRTIPGFEEEHATWGRSCAAS